MEAKYKPNPGSRAVTYRSQPADIPSVWQVLRRLKRVEAVRLHVFGTSETVSCLWVVSINGLQHKRVLFLNMHWGTNRGFMSFGKAHKEEIV